MAFWRTWTDLELELNRIEDRIDELRQEESKLEIEIVDKFDRGMMNQIRMEANRRLEKEHPHLIPRRKGRWKHNFPCPNGCEGQIQVEEWFFPATRHEPPDGGIDITINCTNCPPDTQMPTEEEVMELVNMIKEREELIAEETSIRKKISIMKRTLREG